MFFMLLLKKEFTSFRQHSSVTRTAQLGANDAPYLIFLSSFTPLTHSSALLSLPSPYKNDIGVILDNEEKSSNFSTAL